MKSHSIPFILACFVASISLNATAYTDGNFIRTCYAPNWMTGAVEPVAEQNVGDVLSGFHAFASRQPHGRWLIQYNVPKMSREPFTIRRFLFYHECAHAVFNTSDETVADCEGLRMMIDDSGATDEHIRQIANMYRSYGREFPPHGCRL